jgi:hypothetical protein
MMAKKSQRSNALKKQQEENKRLKKEIELYKKTLETYMLEIKLPSKVTPKKRKQKFKVLINKPKVIVGKRNRIKKMVLVKDELPPAVQEKSRPEPSDEPPYTEHPQLDDYYYNVDSDGELKDFNLDTVLEPVKVISVEGLNKS